MTSSEDKTGLIVSVAAYIVLLGAAGLLGRCFQRRRIAKNASGGESASETVEHYLSGRSLGSFVTAMTILATQFSGYTVVGLPNEAYRDGWVALRWLSSIILLSVGYSGTGARLRKISLLRNHQSPCDFITDRFASQVLRYTVVFLQLFPAILYLIAQVISIKITFNSMFGIDANNPVAVIVVSAIILAYEWIGGLSSVAWTDAIQGIVLVVAFLILPVTVSINFGGWVNLEPSTFPKPEFYQVPSSNMQFNMWNMSILSLSFFTLPHFIQRTYAAESMRALKYGYTINTCGSWLLMLVGIYVGIIGVEILGGQPTASPFAEIMNALMEASTMGYVIASIAYVAGLAAIMSTADSLLIAISQLFTSEVVRPLWPGSSDHKITIAGNISSLVAMIIALLVAIFKPTGLGDLARIQFGMSLQAVPTFLVGLFASQRKSWTNVHPWVLAFGAAAGFVSNWCIHSLYVMKGSGWTIDSGFAGCVINVTCCFVGELFRTLWKNCAASHSPRVNGRDYGRSADCRVVPKWDRPGKLAEFGEDRLTPDMIWRCMEGVYEPFVDRWYLPLILLLTLTMLPLSGSGQPGLDVNGNFLYPPNVIAGMPDWAFVYIMYCVVLNVVVLVSLWKLPDSLGEFGFGTESNMIKDMRKSAQSTAASEIEGECGNRERRVHESGPAVVEEIGNEGTDNIRSIEEAIGKVHDT